MKILKKSTICATLFIIMTYILTGAICTNLNVNTRSPVKMGVILYNFDDLYQTILKKELEDIQMRNEEKVKFIFFDGKKQ